MFPERFARMAESERQSERKVASSSRFRASRCRIGGDCRHGSAQWCFCQQAKSPSRCNDKGSMLFSEEDGDAKPKQLANLRRDHSIVRKKIPLSVATYRTDRACPRADLDGL